MRCVVLGTTQGAVSLAKGVINSGAMLIAMISLKKELLPNNSADIQSFARENSIQYYEVDDINKEEQLIHGLDIDFLICAWPKIIQSNIFRIPKILTLGTHPTMLPSNRGRHPMHWSKVLGVHESAVSFFEINEGIDSGKIILQCPFNLEYSDDINVLNARVESLMYSGIITILKNLSLVTKRESQNEQIANNWRKRNVHDILLDTRMSCDMIIKIVQSFTLPYPCAKIIIDNRVIDVVMAKKFRDNIVNMEHGKVLKMENDRIVVKCADALVELRGKEYAFQFLSSRGGGYLHLSTQLLHTKISLRDLTAFRNATWGVA